MTQQIINVGTADKGNGDPLRTAFIKVNNNFNELYAALGADFENLETHLIPKDDDTYDLGSPTKKWRSLYVGGNTIYLDNTPLTVEGGVLKVNGSNVGGSTAWNDVTGKPTFSTVATTGSYSDLSNKPTIPSTIESLSNVTLTTPTLGQVLKYDGANWINVSLTEDSIGNLRVNSSAGGTTIGTVDNPNTGGWGGYDLYIDSGNNSNAKIYIPSVSHQAANLPLQILNNALATSIIQLFGRGGVQVITNNGVNEKVFEFADNGTLIFPDGTAQSTAFTGDRLINGTDKVVLNQEGASRLSMYVNNVEKSRLQINTNDLLFASLLGGVTLSAIDGVGGDWFFRTDGELHSTGGKFLSTAETPAVFGSLDSPLTGASSGTVTIKSGTGAVDGGSIYIQAGTGTTGNNGEVSIKTGTTPYEWQFDNGGNLTIPGEIHGKQLTGLGGTLNGRAVNITPANDASDKQFKFRVDQYGETFSRAYLDMPTAQNNKQVAITFAHENNTAGYIFTQGADTFDDGLNNAFNIFYNAGDIKLTAMPPVTGTFKTWKFGSDGDLTLPGNIQSNGNIDVEINLADSTLRRWSFGEDGDFVLPRGSLKPDSVDGFLTIEGPVTADMIDAGTPGIYDTISNGVEILTHRPGDDLDRKFRFSWDGALYMPTDSSNGQVGALEWRINNDATTSQVRSTPGGGIFPPGLALVSYGENPGISFNVAFHKNWIFDQYGNTRIPGDIRSEGNINIDINLTDSTLRRWSFGEDGDFTIPGNLIYGGDTIHAKESTSTAGNPLTVRAGDSETQVGGNLILRGGDTIGSVGTPRNSGWAVLRAGSTVTGNGGYAELLGGNTTAGTGGQAYVTAGSTTTGNGGPVEITAGDTVTGDGGSVTIESGEAVTGTAGNINITAKGTVTGDGGNVNLTGGSVTSGNGGAINLTAGDTIGSGDPGTIRLRTFNAAAPQDWTFGFDGGLTLPNNGVIQETIVTNELWGTTTTSMTLVPGGAGNATQRIEIYATGAGEGDHIHIRSGNQSQTDLFLGNDTQYFAVAASGANYIQARNGAASTGPGVSAGAGANVNIYGGNAGDNGGNVADGNSGGDVFIASGISTAGLGGDIFLQTSSGPTGFGSIKLSTDGGSSYLEFNEANQLVFPDSTTQTTAWTKSAAAVQSSAPSSPVTGQLWYDTDDGNTYIWTGSAWVDSNPAAAAPTVDITNTNGIDTNYSITFVETRDTAQILRADVDLTFNSWSNTLTAGNVTTGILKIEDGVHEKFQTKSSATGVVTHDCSLGHVFYHTLPSANWTVNLTNLNLAVGYATAVTLVIEQGATGRYPSAVQVAGNAVPLAWQGNTTPTPSSNRFDVVTFSILYDGLYTVLGQLTGF